MTTRRRRVGVRGTRGIGPAAMLLQLPHWPRCGSTGHSAWSPSTANR